MHNLDNSQTIGRQQWRNVSYNENISLFRLDKLQRAAVREAGRGALEVRNVFFSPFIHKKNSVASNAHNRIQQNDEMENYAVML